MNIITCRAEITKAKRDLRHLERKRAKAKDKARWDVNNTGEWQYLKEKQKHLVSLLRDALVQQGQFDHAERG